MAEQISETVDRDRQVRPNKRMLPFLKTVQQLGWYRPQKDYEKAQTPPPPPYAGLPLEKPQAPTTTTVLPLEKLQTPLGTTIVRKMTTSREAPPPPYAEGLPLEKPQASLYYLSRSPRHHHHRTQKDYLSRSTTTTVRKRTTSREAAPPPYTEGLPLEKPQASTTTTVRRVGPRD